MRFEALLDRQERGELSQIEAAEMLGVSERTFRRWRDRLRDEGPQGLADRRIGKPSGRRAAADEILRMLGLYREHYADFTVKHFHEQLVKRHDYQLGYTVTKLQLHRAGLVKPAPRRGAHRKKRPRRPMPGMLLHQDASRHAWLDGAPPLDLVVTLDDATSEVYSAFLVEEEGTASSFRGLAEVVAAKGLFCALYTDRGSHYFHTPTAGGKVSRTQLTQVGRALAQLGIEHIAAYSPEARGRSERVFRPCRTGCRRSCGWPASPASRPPTAGWPRFFTAEHNARFAVPADRTAPPSSPTGRAWREILCVPGTRLGNDNTVKWKPALLADPAVAAAAPLRARQGARPRISRWPPRRLLGAAPACRLRRRRRGNPSLSTKPPMSLAPCSEPSRPSPAGRAKGAALTAPAREAPTGVRAGTEKRASSRTKKRTSGERHTAPARTHRTGAASRLRPDHP